MNNRRQFLINAGATVAAFAVPSIVRSATPAGRPDYDVASFDVPGLGKVRSLRFASTADRPAISIVAAVVEVGRSHQRRFTDLLIAATAHANGLALYTRNPDDFVGLDVLVDIVGI